MEAAQRDPVAPGDARYMRRALELAERGLGLAPPNPLVGAVVVAGGRVIGQGWHEGPGTPHAEIVALRQAGDRTGGATLYLTLEPCSHQGRTPPCAPVVRDSGVVRVVAALRDPNPVVDGRGFALLRAAGLEVTEGVLESEATRLNAGFARWVRTGLPLVTLKMAASMDGKVAARDGSSRWITGERARRDVHRLRAGSDAVMVGSGTGVSDDPSLTVRLDGYRGRQPLRVVVDGNGRTPPTAAVFDGDAPALIATTPRAPQEVRSAWAAAGGEVVVLDGGDESGALVPLDVLVEVLGKREVQNVLVEGGPTLAWAAVRAGVVDRVVLYLAPKLVGGRDAPGILGGHGIDTIAEAVTGRIELVQAIGDDLKVVMDVHRDR